MGGSSSNPKPMPAPAAKPAPPAAPKKLALLDIRHGDVHEMNIVFEVPGERARAFAAFAAGDGKRAKRALMDCLLYTSPSPRD